MVVNLAAGGDGAIHVRARQTVGLLFHVLEFVASVGDGVFHFPLRDRSDRLTNAAHVVRRFGIRRIVRAADRNPMASEAETATRVRLETLIAAEGCQLIRAQRRGVDEVIVRVLRRRVAVDPDLRVRIRKARNVDDALWRERRGGRTSSTVVEMVVADVDVIARENR